MPPTRQSVEDAVCKYFREDEKKGVLMLLDRYDGKERERVQLCILVLSEGDIEKIKHNVSQAIMDYRDVLYWADPHGMRF